MPCLKASPAPFASITCWMVACCAGRVSERGWWLAVPAECLSMRLWQAWTTIRATGKLMADGGTLVIGREQDCKGGCFDSDPGALQSVLLCASGLHIWPCAGGSRQGAPGLFEC